MRKSYKNLGAVILLIGALSMACSDDLKTEGDFLAPAPEADKNMEENNPYWGWVGTFPGWIDVNLERVDNTPVVIDGMYTKMKDESRIDFKQTPWISTGYYAAPGEVVTLVKPSRLRTRLSWRIGAWKCELGQTADLKRYGKVSETGVFDRDTVKIKSWFGGHVYIMPEETFVRPETFIIKGAIKSPDFIYGKTDVAAWKQEMQTTKLPYAELIGKKTIWTLPVATLKKITDPAGLLELYDNIIENDFNGFHGLSDEVVGTLDVAPAFPVRIVQDIQLCSGKASHAGYPMVIDQSEADLGTDVDGMRSTSIAWNFYKELGRNYQTWCWSWTGVKEVVNLIPYYHSRARMLGAWPTVRNEKDESDRGVLKWEYVIRDYVLCTDAAKDFEMTDIKTAFGKSINTQNARMMPFVQLAQQYGWGLYGYLGKCSRELSARNAAVLKILSSPARRDFFCKRVCEYANADLSPFFDAWGIKYSVTAEDDMKSLPKYQGEKFWEKWEASKMPDFQERTPADVKLPDDNYNNVESQFDQTKWTVDSTSGTPSEYTPGVIINGKLGDYWASEKISNRPHYDSRVWVAMDMKRVYNVSQVYAALRDFTANWRANPKNIRIEVKMNPEDEWEKLADITMAQLAGTMQNFDLDDSKPGRYVKIIFVEGFPISGDATDTGGVSLCEFSLGGTLYISDEGEDNNTGGDTDFPEWK